MKIDINVDMGESFGRYTLGNDEEVMKYITSANIAAGFHAGDSLVMEKTIQFAKNTMLQLVHMWGLMTNRALAEEKLI